MAPNFRISVYRSSLDLHLKLVGDFDGSSAHELLNVLKAHRRGATRIFIHTDSLKEIHEFGRVVFHNNLRVRHGEPVSLLFTGGNAAQLAPEGCRLC
jgi:hypothetical protein